MRYRPQSSTDARSQMLGTLGTLADRQAARPRSFKTFKTLKAAFAWMEKHDDAEPKLRKAVYTSDPRDTRFVVNFNGKLRITGECSSSERVIMWHGMTVDRRLPVRVQIS